MKLNEIFRKYSCDKDTHHYYEVYAKDFEPRRNDPINILEVGIHKGSSHSSWVDYFPNAQVYGIDIFTWPDGSTRITPEQISILKHERVHWLKADSTLPIYSDIKSAWGDVKFDFIIDDGLHTPEANTKTFENLIGFLKDDGIFYIEDVWPLDIMTENEWSHHWIKNRPERYNLELWNGFAKVINQYKVTNIDLRGPSRMPDSYIVKIEK